jgi:hypothetical protein
MSVAPAVGDFYSVRYHCDKRDGTELKTELVAYAEIRRVHDDGESVDIAWVYDHAELMKAWASDAGSRAVVRRALSEMSFEKRADYARSNHYERRFPRRSLLRRYAPSAFNCEFRVDIATRMLARMRPVAERRRTGDDGGSDSDDENVLERRHVARESAHESVASEDVAPGSEEDVGSDDAATSSSVGNRTFNVSSNGQPARVRDRTRTVRSRRRYARRSPPRATQTRTRTLASPLGDTFAFASDGQQETGEGNKTNGKGARHAVEDAIPAERSKRRLQRETQNQDDREDAVVCGAHVARRRQSVGAPPIVVSQTDDDEAEAGREQNGRHETLRSQQTAEDTGSLLASVPMALSATSLSLSTSPPPMGSVAAGKLSEQEQEQEQEQSQPRESVEHDTLVGSAWRRQRRLAARSVRAISRDVEQKSAGAETGDSKRGGPEAPQRRAGAKHCDDASAATEPVALFFGGMSDMDGAREAAKQHSGTKQATQRDGDVEEEWEPTSPTAWGDAKELDPTIFSSPSVAPRTNSNDKRLRSTRATVCGRRQRSERGGGGSGNEDNVHDDDEGDVATERGWKRRRRVAVNAPTKSRVVERKRARRERGGTASAADEGSEMCRPIAVDVSERRGRSAYVSCGTVELREFRDALCADPALFFDTTYGAKKWDILRGTLQFGAGGNDRGARDFFRGHVGLVERRLHTSPLDDADGADVEVKDVRHAGDGDDDNNDGDGGVADKIGTRTCALCRLPRKLCCSVRSDDDDAGVPVGNICLARLQHAHRFHQLLWRAHSNFSARGMTASELEAAFNDIEQRSVAFRPTRRRTRK